jgi:hypothetical protein
MISDPNFSKEEQKYFPADSVDRRIKGNGLDASLSLTPIGELYGYIQMLSCCGGLSV